MKVSDIFIAIVFTAVLLWILSMCAVTSKGQSYYHDPTLDSINNNIAVLDSDFNAGTNGALTQQQYSNTTYLVSQNGIAELFTNMESGHTFTNTVMDPNLPLFTASALLMANTNATPLQTNISAFVSNSIGAFSTNTVFSSYAGSGSSAINKSFTLGSLGGSTYTWTIDFNPNSNSYTSPYAYYLGVLSRGIILSIFCLLVVSWALNDLHDHIDKWYRQNQTQGSAQEILGNNASAFTGLGYGVIAVGVLAATLALLASSGTFSIFTAYLGGSSSLFDPNFFNTMYSNLPWGYFVYLGVVNFLPLGTMLTIFLAYWYFSYVTMPIAFYFARSITKFSPV